MYNILLSNPTLAIIFIVLVVIICLFLAVKTLQKVGLERVQAIAYKAIMRAERNFLYGDNKQKFDYVVQLARSSLPKPFNLFISEALLRKVIQMWFNLVKDFLDALDANKNI